MNPDSFQAPFYALAPKIRLKGGELYISTPFLGYLLSLFSHFRVVHVSGRRKSLEIKIKKWWQWKQPVRIAFSNIDYVDLACPRLPEHEKDNPNDIFDLFLIAKDPFRKVKLFRFRGLGSGSRTCEKIAKSCAELIADHTRTSFGLKAKKLPLADFDDKYICSACGHRLHPDAEFILCPYCGGKNIRII